MTGDNGAPGDHARLAGAPIVVTGATGFLGRSLVEELVALGADVHAVRRRPGGGRAGVTWHVADLEDEQATKELIASVEPQVVFHLAGAVTGRANVELVRPILEANLIGAVNLLVAVAERPTTRLILAGSMEEPRSPAEVAPSTPYAAAKGAATAYAQMFHRLWGVDSTVLRIAMAYGPGQSDVTKLVPHVARSLLSGERPQLTSGTRLIDWVYVDDVVEAFVSAATSRAAAGHVIEIGSGRATSIRDTAELIGRIVGSDITPDYGVLADRPLVTARIADIGAAREILRWRPTIDPAEGMRRTVAALAREMNIELSSPGH